MGAIARSLVRLGRASERRRPAAGRAAGPPAAPESRRPEEKNGPLRAPHGKERLKSSEGGALSKERPVTLRRYSQTLSETKRGS